MKGKKLYEEACKIRQLMYSTQNGISSEKKMILYEKYFQLIKTSAYRGYTEAFYELGLQYEDTSFLGMPNPNMNAKKCIYWFTKACNAGHAEACNSLSSFYEKGDGCKQDLNLSLHLLKRSAELGSFNGKSNYKILLKQLGKTS